MPAQITFNARFTSINGSEERPVTLTRAVVGGWTGRDKAALQHHIDELVKIGVTPPETTPVFYRVGVSRLTTADEIEVIGDGSSGEVEYALILSDGEIWVGAASDHTDRVFEHLGITIAKQLCDKPIATEFWPLSEVEDHWDQIQIRAHISENGQNVIYQDGKVSGLLSPKELLSCLHETGDDLTEGTFLFGGTCGAEGGVRYSDEFSFSLIDPVLNREISHTYKVTPVPILG